MNKKFCNSRKQELTFSDDGVIFGRPSIMIENELIEELIPYGRIKTIKLKKFSSMAENKKLPVLEVVDTKKLLNTNLNESYIYVYEMHQKDELKEMLSFAKAKMKSGPSVQSEQTSELSVQVIDSLSFNYKNREIRIGKGLFAKRIPVSSITTCEGMSYWEDTAFHKVKITFNAGIDRYIIQGRTFDSVRDIPFREYYDNIVKDSAMSEEEKEIALHNKSYGNVELSAKGVIQQASESGTNKEKEASVVGRAVVGAVIAGPTGAIVGALSAVDKNNKNKKQ